MSRRALIVFVANGNVEVYSTTDSSYQVTLKTLTNLAGHNLEIFKKEIDSDLCYFADLNGLFYSEPNKHFWSGIDYIAGNVVLVGYNVETKEIRLLEGNELIKILQSLTFTGVPITKDLP